MKRLLLLLSLALIPTTCKAQHVDPKSAVDSIPQPRIVIVDDYVRELLAEEWDKVANNPQQNERAFCLQYQMDYQFQQAVWRVVRAWPAQTEGATQHGIVDADCPKGPTYTLLHTHPPASCYSDTYCTLGGVEAYQCFPSDTDQNTVDTSGEPFEGIQCDRKAVVWFFPSPKN